MATVNVKLCFMLSGISAQKAEEEKTGKGITVRNKTYGDNDREKKKT